MGRGKSLDDLSMLPIEVLDEVVREAELRIAAQLETANASDQRAMAWCGFLITIATAGTGGAISLSLSGAHSALATLATIFSFVIGVAAFLAIDCVRPKYFGFPGNLPENWLPAEWEAGKPLTLFQARIEQARCLNNLIDDNVVWAKTCAVRLQLSMDIAVWAVIFAGIIAGALALFDFR